MAFSLLEIMVAVAVLGSLFAIAMGRSPLSFLLPGKASPSEQWDAMAERLARGSMCHLADYDLDLSKCVAFGPKGCMPAATRVALDCLLEHRNSVPPVMTLEEERLLIEISAPCIDRMWLPSLRAKYELDYTHPTCDALFNPMSKTTESPPRPRPAPRRNQRHR